MPRAPTVAIANMAPFRAVANLMGKEPSEAALRRIPAPRDIMRM
jgi:hypothetical protein